MMIIDSHTHIGDIQFEVGKNRVKNLPEKDLIISLEKYKIDFAVVSCLEGAEFDSDYNLAPGKMQVSQKEGLGKLTGFVAKNKTRVRGLFWIKPYHEHLTDEIEKLVTDNRDLICGLKVHPTLSNLKFTDKKYWPYLEMAVRLNLPVEVHTENDGRSDVKYLGKMASVFPELKFIMVHMGMNSDNTEAVSVIKNSTNIYGDTCIVKHENVLNAIRECGSDKILFGTDSTVNGIDTYERYLPLIDKINNTFSEKDALNVLGLNCMTIFNLPVSLK
jgi:predicted TIM-barrel fold metal-dependent hydrolase